MNTFSSSPYNLPRVIFPILASQTVQFDATGMFGRERVDVPNPEGHHRPNDQDYLS